MSGSLIPSILATNEALPQYRQGVGFPERVHITESSPRDGLQSLGAFIPTEAKAKLIDDYSPPQASRLSTPCRS